MHLIIPNLDCKNTGQNPSNIFLKKPIDEHKMLQTLDCTKIITEYIFAGVGYFCKN